MTDTRHDADVAFIQALTDLLHQKDLSELEVRRDYGEHDSLKVRVSKQMLAPVPAAALPASLAMPSVVPTSADHAAEAAPAALAEDPASHPGAVTSPMVGTVYLQAEPGSDSFIESGKTVTKGQTLLIVEAMKTMNHISAPRDGTVSRILVEDGAPVEFGAPLVILS